MKITAPFQVTFCNTLTSVFFRSYSLGCTCASVSSFIALRHPLYSISSNIYLVSTIQDITNMRSFSQCKQLYSLGLTNVKLWVFVDIRQFLSREIRDWQD